MKNLLFVFGALFVSTFAFSQVISGRVFSEKTKEPLPFVNVSVKNTTAGITADVEGRFEFKWNGGAADLIFSYVGYEPLVYSISGEAKNLHVELKEKSTELNEVVVSPGENPALRIIRKAILNKPLNNPENLSSFTYNAYNKLYLAMEPTGDTARNKKEKRLQKFAEQNHLFVSESYTERKYIRPNLTQETVLANRMSGVKDPVFAFLATDFQPFSFYKDFIPLLSTNYLNPLTAGSPGKYDFTLSDTLYHETDSVFVISFEPLPGKSFEALKGQLYISSDGYALEHVLAQPADPKSLVEIRIQQKYSKTEGHWFPVQLNTEFRFTEFKMGNLKLMYVDRSYLSNIHIGIPIPKKQFGLLNVQFDPNTGRQTESFWVAHRADSLHGKEKNTYHFYDSLAPSLNFLNLYMKLVEGFVVGRFKVGSFYLPLDYLYKYNQYEGSRYGFGLQTGERISKFFALEGYAGYGTKDRAWKYGGGLQLNLFPNKDGYLKFSYKQDLSEPGGFDYIGGPLIPGSNESLRSWMASRMDSIRQYKAEFTVRPLRFSRISFFLQHQERDPTYRYSFVTESGGVQQNFTVAETGIQWRLAWKESYTQIGNSRVVTNIAYPKVNLFFSKGIAGFWQGQYNFTKLEARIDDQWVIRGFGRTTIQLDAGKVIGNVPYPFLFNGKGSNFSSSFFNSFVVNNYFQTMGLYEFLSDQFAYFFLTHNFGRLTGTKISFFRPELLLVHNMGIGSLKNPEDHIGIQFKTMEKGFVESGLMLNNILRLKTAKLFYYGLGAGAFYRYGSYAMPNQSDNFAFKVIVTASF